MDKLEDVLSQMLGNMEEMACMLDDMLHYIGTGESSGHEHLMSHIKDDDYLTIDRIKDELKKLKMQLHSQPQTKEKSGLFSA